jgi:hypothetical protein
MNWVKRVSNWILDQEEEEEKTLKVKKYEQLPSLRNRDTPIDLLTKASFRIAKRKHAQYSVNPDKSFLTVILPKRGSKTKTKEYVMPLYDSLGLLFNDVKEAMEYDEFDTMDAMRLAAEYPNFFWNGMFHTLGSIEGLEHQMSEYGISSKRKRRKT